MVRSLTWLLALLVGLGLAGPTVAQSFFDPATKKWVSYKLTPEAASKIARKKFKRKSVSYRTDEAPGTLIVDTRKRWLYHVQENGKAVRYGIGVGKEGFTWKGT
ncbi:ErfK/YbiS/YcfS/YnhG family protein [Roseibium sp. TrichSKD4]|uniref:hypothetical protein n=1 Tax=Roseibium sp. TrichSKD4 TaxID=744980 RepID=UPI0001E56561|nr:ErfK/YbiS/YcfS/YnhG family protein [Roseibium sp. TrichSKD4]